jgi:hypothetical protein
MGSEPSGEYDCPLLIRPTHSNLALLMGPSLLALTAFEQGITIDLPVWSYDCLQFYRADRHRIVGPIRH